MNDRALTVTWEAVLWAVILCLAAVLRFADIGSAPLSPQETVSALAAWNVYHGVAVDMPDGSLFTYGTALIFFLFGASDVTARLLPAASGVALVFLPTLLRRQIGPLSCLASGLFLATSPTLVLYSRQVNSVMVVACLSLAVVVFLLKLDETERFEWAYAAAVAGGALLAGGPTAFTALTGIACFVLAQVWRLWPTRDRGGEMPRSVLLLWRLGQEASGSEESKADGTRGLYRYVSVGGVTGVLLATGFLSNLHGIQQGVVDTAWAWAAGLAGAGSLGSLTSLPLLLIIYDPLLSLLGVVGAASLASTGRWLAGGLVWWVAAGLILASPVSGLSPGVAVLPVVSFGLLAGVPAGGLLSQSKERMARRDVVAFASVAVPLLWLVVFALGHLSRPSPVVPSMLGAVPVVCLILVVGIFGYRVGWRRTLNAAGLVGVGVLIVLSVHTSSILQRAGVEPPGAVATVVDARALAEDVKDARDALAVAGREGRIRVDVSLASPLAWYLRDLPAVFDNRPGDSDRVVITRSESPAPTWRHVTQRYVLLKTSAPWAEGFGQRWLWYFYREATSDDRVMNVDMHVRV